MTGQRAGYQAIIVGFSPSPHSPRPPPSLTPASFKAEVRRRLEGQRVTVCTNERLLIPARQALIPHCRHHRKRAPPFLHRKAKLHAAVLAWRLIPAAFAAQRFSPSTSFVPRLPARIHQCCQNTVVAVTDQSEGATHQTRWSRASLVPDAARLDPVPDRGSSNHSFFSIQGRCLHRWGCGGWSSLSFFGHFQRFRIVNRPK